MIKLIYLSYTMGIKRNIVIWMGSIVCVFSQVPSRSKPISETLRSFLNWVYTKQPELYASLPKNSDETLNMYSEKLAQHIIYVQSIQNSSDMYSTARKTTYQRILFELMKKDQKIQIKAAPTPVDPIKMNEKKDCQDLEEHLIPQELSEPLGSFVLQYELESRQEHRKRRIEHILQENPNDKTTIRLLVNAVYDEIFHRIHLFKRYAQSLCFQDSCVEKIQTILWAPMDNFMKIKQLIPLLHTLEQENTRYAHQILEAGELEEDFQTIDFKLPGIRTCPLMTDGIQWSLLKTILKLYPLSTAARQLYHTLCISFLIQTMGEVALHPESPLSILALMLDATEELRNDWDTEKFKNLLSHWPKNTIISKVLTKNLKKLAHVLPLALTQKNEWNTITKSCEQEYEKITDIIQKIIKRS